MIHHAGPLATDERVSLRTGVSDDSPNLFLESADSSLDSSLVPFDDEIVLQRDRPHHFFAFLSVQTIL